MQQHNKDMMNNKFMEMVDKNPKEMYTKTINTLVEMNHEDKLTIYTLLSVLIGYTSNIEFNDCEIRDHKEIINRICVDLDIKIVSDIKTKITETLDNLHINKLKSLKSLNGIH